jgi:hypothetical protein
VLIDQLLDERAAAVVRAWVRKPLTDSRQRRTPQQPRGKSAGSHGFSLKASGHGRGKLAAKRKWFLGLQSNREPGAD